MSPVGQSNWLFFFIIQLPRRVLRVYWLGYLPGSVFQERVSGVSSLVCTSLNLYMVAAKRTVCATTIKRRVDVQLSESLLFLHAISGCDTTSRPHGIGKVGVLKKYAALAESTATFMASESSKVAVEKAGERALLIMYGSQVDDLKTARLQKFQTKVATAAGYVPPEKLPPTSDATQISQSPCLSPGISMERERSCS